MKNIEAKLRQPLKELLQAERYMYVSRQDIDRKDLVGQSSSGIPRILQVYNKNVLQFSDNFLRIDLPASESSASHGTEQATEQVDGNNNMQQIQKEFGSIAKRLDISSIENKEFIESNYSLFILYLEEGFGITSEKLRKRFGKASDSKISNQEMTLMLISLESKITANEIAQILDVSSRTSEKYIQRLREVHLIERIGERKEGVWQIVKQRK